MVAEIKFQKMTTEGKRIRGVLFIIIGLVLFIIGLFLFFYGYAFPFDPIYSFISFIGFILFIIGLFLLAIFSIAVFGSRFNLFNLVK
jgi:uncharacterized membrane protein